MGGARPTMLDVARAADVSIKTVSRVVNAEGGVAPQTRARVNDAIGSLGYRRNDLARSLRTRTASATIGLVIGDLANPFYSRIARAVEQRVRCEGSLLITASSDEDPELERELVHALLSRRVDGLLLVPAEADHSWLQRETRRGAHVVFVDRPARNGPADAIVFDNVGGARLAVDHLVGLGRRRIAVIADNPELFTARERLAGFATAMAAANLPVDQDLVRAGVHDAESAREVTIDLLRMAHPPDALFTANNRITIGALRGMQAVARSVSVVGFDEVELSDVLGLTVVSGDAPELGRTAVDRLYARIGGDQQPPRLIRIAPRLVVREPLWGIGARKQREVGLERTSAP
jgi:LacI family transcriptional regulator